MKFRTSKNRAVRALRTWPIRYGASLAIGLAASCTPGPFVPPGDVNEPTPELQITTRRVADGLDRPVFVTAPLGDTDRLFIVEQHTGRIRILDLETLELQSTPFVTVGDLATGNEQRLLGFAFAPDFADTGRFYLNRTRFDGTTEILRGTISADPDVANPELDVVLSIPQPFGNHNGGWIGFGPDGFLYVASGDGGAAFDPGDRAQDTTGQLLGKLLRLDVSGRDGFTIPAGNPFVGAAGDDEIWALGLRNPWRCSFDRLTGDLYIGDVGQNEIEEISVQPAGAGGGTNYGWPCREGNGCLGTRLGCTCDAPDLTPPVYDYPPLDVPVATRETTAPIISPSRQPSFSNWGKYGSGAPLGSPWQYIHAAFASIGSA